VPVRTIAGVRPAEARCSAIRFGNGLEYQYCEQNYSKSF